MPAARVVRIRRPAEKHRRRAEAAQRQLAPQIQATRRRGLRREQQLQLHPLGGPYPWYPQTKNGTVNRAIPSDILHCGTKLLYFATTGRGPASLIARGASNCSKFFSNRAARSAAILS